MADVTKRSNVEFKEHFSQHGEGTNITSNLQNCVCWSAELRVVHFIVYGCESWTVNQRIKSQLEATEMWFLRRRLCCVLHGLTRCQMKKYFKEPIHQEISWRLLLTGISDLCTWDRHIVRKSQLQKAISLTGMVEGKRAIGRQRKTFMDWLSFACREQWKVNDIGLLKSCHQVATSRWPSATVNAGLLAEFDGQIYRRRSVHRFVHHQTVWTRCAVTQAANAPDRESSGSSRRHVGIFLHRKASSPRHSSRAAPQTTKSILRHTREEATSCSVGLFLHVYICRPTCLDLIGAYAKKIQFSPGNITSMQTYVYFHAF